MREIKVRGYAVDEMIEGQWIYGTGIHKTVFTDEYAAKTGVKEEWFVFTKYGWVQVEPKSIGQYTGLNDKNGAEIFERDIVNYGAFDLSVIKYEDGTFWARLGQYPLNVVHRDIEVRGNTYEHPHLLEVFK